MTRKKEGKITSSCTNGKVNVNILLRSQWLAHDGFWERVVKGGNQETD